MLKLLDSHLYKADVPDRLRHLVMYIARAGKYINHALQMGDMGATGTQNKSGDDQLALDVLTDKIIMENLDVCNIVSHVISEEQDDITICECKENKEVYSVAYDPLDGSSLVETNLAIGSIFAIFEGKGFIGRTGREMVAAINIVYGPRTTLMYTVGKGTHEFTLNDVGEFTLTAENITIKDSAKHFAPGNLRAGNKNAKYKKLVNHWMDEEYTLRYSGGMAADINHILKKGEGIFTYPPNPPKYPKGKLRLLFECNPFSFLMEQAGGASSNGEVDIMDIEVTELHQRTPIYIGSKEEVKTAVEMMK